MFAPVPPRDARCRVLYLSPLKALAVDVERNLRAPLAGIAHLAAAAGVPHHVPAMSIRTGDTPTAERARFQRDPADILITTPESLFLLLTSNARERLRAVDTVIVDEIHALVSTKRGAHLALSLERLERIVERPLQRIGLSATQRNLDEIARFLGGTIPAGRRAGGKARGGADPARSLHDEFADATPGAPRAVTVVDAREPKKLAITVEVPIDDMAKVGQPVEQPSGPAAQGGSVQTIWTSIHPRLLELVRAHRSTLLFVNSRRLAERLAAALNELAGEPLVRAHHGSLARAAAHRDRGPAQGRPAAGAGGDLVARAGHRHGRHRPGGADRSAAVGGQRAAAHRPVRPPGGRDQRRGDLPEVPRRPAGLRGGHRGDDRRAGRAVALPAQPAGRAGAADRGDDGDGSLVGRRPVRRGARRRAVRRAEPPGVRRRARHAVGPVSLGRVRRAAAAGHLGPRQRHDRGPRGRQAGGDQQRRHDSRPRALRRVPRRRLARRRPRRRARRGDGLRGAGRRDLPARRLDLAHRADHPRPRAGLAGAGRARQDAVLAGRGPGPADRARSGHRQAHPRAAPRRPGRGDGAPHQRSRAERRGRRQPAAVPGRPAGGDRRRPRRPHHPDRALPGRPRRLAGVGAHAVRQPGPRPLGDGRHRAAARRARPRRRGDVERRRLRRPPARGRRADRSGAARARSRRRRAAGRAPARFDGALRRPLPRGRRPGAAAAAPPPRTTRAAVAAAQARRRPAGRRRALRLVPDHPRGLSRVRARRLRPAGAGRPAGQGAQPQRAGAHRGRAEVVAVRGVAALRLRRQLPLRRRRAAGRAPRARPVGGPGAAGRADRRRRAADAGRSRRAGRARARRAAAAGEVPRAIHRRRPRPAAAAGRSLAGRDRGAVGAGRRRAGRRRTGRAAARAAGADCRRGAAHRRGGRGPLPRRRRHAAPCRAAGVAGRAGPRSADRPGPPLRPHARTVHGPGSGRPARRRRGGRGRDAAATR